MTAAVSVPTVQQRILCLPLTLCPHSWLQALGGVRAEGHSVVDTALVQLDEEELAGSGLSRSSLSSIGTD